MHIEIYKTEGRPLLIQPNFQAVVPASPELQDFCDENWGREHQGWKSSWVAYASAVTFREDQIEITAGAISYKNLIGQVKAIQAGHSFAPTCVGSLATGVYGMDADGNFLLLRRGSGVKHAPFLYNPPIPLMASMHLDKATCEDQGWVSDPRIYDINYFAAKGLEKEASITPKNATIGEAFAITSGTRDSCTLNLAIPASFHNSLQNPSTALAGQTPFAPGRVEHDQITVVPLATLEKLLLNQGDLHQGTLTPDPADPTRLPLVDHVIGGIYVLVEQAAGVRAMQKIKAHLTAKEVRIVEKEVQPGTTYIF